MRVKFDRHSLEKKNEFDLVLSSVFFDVKSIEVHDFREVDKREGLLIYHASVELFGHCTLLGDSLLLRVMLSSGRANA